MSAPDEYKRPTQAELARIGTNDAGESIYSNKADAEKAKRGNQPTSVNQELKRYGKTKAAKDANPTSANKAEHMKSIGRVKVAESSESRGRSSSKKYENQY